jgi:hypothetical protein
MAIISSLFVLLEFIMMRLYLLSLVVVLPQMTTFYELLLRRLLTVERGRSLLLQYVVLELRTRMLIISPLRVKFCVEKSFTSPKGDT